MGSVSAALSVRFFTLMEEYKLGNVILFGQNTNKSFSGTQNLIEKINERMKDSK